MNYRADIVGTQFTIKSAGDQGTVVSCLAPRSESAPQNLPKARCMQAKRTAARSKIRVFLVDDHPIVRRGFQLMLSMEPDLMVCGEADSGPAALQKIMTLKPDVAIVDLSLKAAVGWSWSSNSGRRL